MHKTITIGGNSITSVKFGNDQPISLISGTCAIESRDITMKTAETLKNLSESTGFSLVYKGSFDKANRTSSAGQRGVGLDEGLKILQEVKDAFDVPVLTDIHDLTQVQAVGEVVDVIQIPAFLSRQTDLLVACAATGKAINIKKAQFMAPQDVGKAAEKVINAGNDNILLTERGTTFGYNNLVVDMRGLVIMAETGLPVIMDATHAVMQPSVRGTSSGGRRDFMPPLARAAIAIGVAGLFLETHPDPSCAISDKETQVPLELMPALLKELRELDSYCKSQSWTDLPAFETANAA